MSNDRAMANCEDDYLAPPEHKKNNDNDDLYNESQEYDSDEDC